MNIEIEPARCAVCNGLLSWAHDHRDDFAGLDDGPYRERKKAVPKLAAEISEIRARAWATRREKYGQRGHR